MIFFVRYFSTIVLVFFVLGCKPEFSECGSTKDKSFDVLSSGEFLNILLIGDAGIEGERRRGAMQSVRKIMGNTHFHMAFLLGDNFYPSGVKSVHEARWQEDFELLYDPDLFNFNFYSVLGNHDYQGNILAQIDYTSLSERWKMESRYFSKTFPYGKDDQHELLVIFLDTNTIRKSSLPDDNAQILWLEQQLANATTEQIIVAGHHPIYSNGKHGNNAYLEGLLVELFEEYGVDLYVNGHDHDIQIINEFSDIYYVTSGAFAKTRGTNCGENSLYASSSSVAVALHVNADTMALLPISSEGSFDYYVEF